MAGSALLLVGIAVQSRDVAGQEPEEPSPTGVLWSAEHAGWHCQLGEHHIVMSDEAQVWALDLRTGTRSWSVDIDGRSTRHACLPGVGLVALTSLRDIGSGPREDTRLVDGATGEEHWRFPHEAATHVLDLGAVIGLLDSSNVLTAVTPDAMDSPLWRYQLASPPSMVTHADIEPIDDDFVAVIIGIDHDVDGVERRVVLRSADGTTPAWAPDSTEKYTQFQRHDGVTLRWIGGDDEHSLTALDDAGTELWTARDVEARSIADRLYLLDEAARGSGYSGIRLIDSQTGTALAQVSETADWVTALPGGRIGLISEAQAISLDSDLGEQGRESMANRIFEFADENHIFIGEFISGDWERVLALTTLGGDVGWQTDLVPDQRIERIGTHLVTTDDDNGIIQGLRGPA